MERESEEADPCQMYLCREAQASKGFQQSQEARVLSDLIDPKDTKLFKLWESCTKQWAISHSLGSYTFQKGTMLGSWTTSLIIRAKFQDCFNIQTARQQTANRQSGLHEPGSSSLGRASFALNLSSQNSTHTHTRCGSGLTNPGMRDAIPALRWPWIESMLQHHSGGRRRLYRQTLQRYPGPTSCLLVDILIRTGFEELSSQQIPSKRSHSPQFLVLGARLLRSAETQDLWIFSRLDGESVSWAIIVTFAQGQTCLCRVMIKNKG